MRGGGSVARGGGGGEARRRRDAPSAVTRRLYAYGPSRAAAPAPSYARRTIGNNGIYVHFRWQNVADHKA